jgi:glutamate racemase
MPSLHPPTSLSVPAAPIGVFDSGIGGLSVLLALRTLLPHEDYLYCADTAHAPYGEKSEAYIRERCFALAEFLLAQGAKALVIACNTATAVALKDLRLRYTVPVIALEPALKPAVAASRSGVVGVLATRRTVESAHFQGQVARYGGAAHILPQPCPRLVTLLESGAQDTPEMAAALQGYLAPLLAEGADALVLGCTHFVFLRDAIQALVGTNIALFDSGAGVARVLRDRLHSMNALNPQTNAGSVRFWSSAATPATTAVMARLWGAPLTVQHL